MIEIRFSRQRLARWEKKKYARVLKKIITKTKSFLKDVKLFNEFADIEIKIMFK